MGFLAEYLQFIGNSDKAVKISEKICTGNKVTKSVSALNIYGLHLIDVGKYEDALKYLEQSNHLNTEPSKEKFITMSIAGCYWLKDDISKAIETIKNLNSKYSDLNSEVYTTLSFLYLIQKDYENAEKFALTAIDKDNKNGYAFSIIGQIYFCQHKTDKSCDYLIKSLELDNNISDSKYYLGLLKENQGDLNKAKEHFEEAYNSDFNAFTSITKEEISKKLEVYNF